MQRSAPPRGGEQHRQVWPHSWRAARRSMAASNADLQAALLRYDEALTLKSDKLPEWDAWYRGPLREAVRERAESDNKEGAYITRDEVIQLMNWKLARGKFRPMLQQYAASNSEELVHTSTSKGFAILRDAAATDTPPSRDVLVSAIKAITAMKGVGPAMASALLALVRPHALPYMSDEMLAHGAGLRDKPKYNEKEYVWLLEQTTKRLDAAPKAFEHDAEQLEKAAWAFGILKDKGLLDEETNNEEEKPKRKAKSEKDAESTTKKTRKR